ncbi:CDP-alcohol phosphatidyltransferase family protein [Auritidibacter sp. NML100628]|uniref:CDP-alcohol phosphatidyltransferase family protein n=1 Tax=Auritidibacter sp. NML100628 TaxID=2170742 RepID=UPI000D72EDAF|nr:CDP-alcohol phosphatidyltransferase family protein [Auritidibacter sp. NML100628]PXA77193.1 CDP-diacylglycerol--glycerol-3-phosphate 3-phosphatidyltransferase [Auritidibacter sp. NML100628]
MRLIGAGTRDDIDYVVTDRWLTIPNIITFVRFLLVPVFVWLLVIDEYVWAFITLVVLFSTDWIDGYLARRLNQVSTVGKWLDPVADRIGIIIVVVSVALSGFAPWWLALSLIVPDLLLAILMAFLFLGSPELEVTVLGKVRTALLMIGIPALVLAQGVAESNWLNLIAYVFLIPGSAGHVLAAVDYAWRGIQKYNSLRSQNINPRHRRSWSMAYTHEPSEDLSHGLHERGSSASD